MQYYIGKEKRNGQWYVTLATMNDRKDKLIVESMHEELRVKYGSLRWDAENLLVLTVNEEPEVEKKNDNNTRDNKDLSIRKTQARSDRSVHRGKRGVSKLAHQRSRNATRGIRN